MASDFALGTPVHYNHPDQGCMAALIAAPPAPNDTTQSVYLVAFPLPGQGWPENQMVIRVSGVPRGAGPLPNDENWHPLHD